MAKNLRKFSRTVSGVAPVAVMVEPRGCPGDCVYCPSQPDAPRSYTIESPAVIRARRNQFRPFFQVTERLQTLERMGHSTDKVELIVMGGTFPAYPKDYRFEFIKQCFDALNGFVSPTIGEAQAANERAHRRCVALCIETRPDWCGREHISECLELGATRLELGVQTIDDDIYRRVRRGHTVADVIEATRLVKEAGLKVYYHWMPGLPGSTPQHDLDLTRVLFDDPRLRPDGLKLYPTLVVKGAELEQWYNEKRYEPWGTGTVTSLLARMKAMVPPYVRISRLMRDIPGEFIVAGSRDSALRGTLGRLMIEENLTCYCTRCREFGHRTMNGINIGRPHLMRLDYEASGGREIFLSFEDNHQTLYGLLRLRIETAFPDAPGKVREVHVFGPEVPIGEKDKEAAQHRGWGELLVRESERITYSEFGRKQLSVLAGVGARQYFSKLGYRLDGTYMLRDLPARQPSLLSAD